MQSFAFDGLPSECLMDQALALRLRGATPAGLVDVQAFSSGDGARLLFAEARFQASPDGELDLGRQAPLSGSYEGLSAMGLSWSRDWRAVQEVRAAGPLPDDPMTLMLAARDLATGASCSHAVRRRYLAPGVQRQELREQGLRGFHYRPATAAPHPALLVVGGSGGGTQWADEMAALLANHGYATLALAYFGVPELPPTLDRIPLEYFGRALDWLGAQAGVDPSRIGVMGCSRGGELALLLAATYPRLRGVVAYVGSGIAWPAYPPSGHSAWTWQGREVPHAAVMEPSARESAPGSGGMEPGSFDEYLVPLRDAAYAEACGIPVERIAGPVLLITGEDDRLWPSTALSEFAMRRLQARGSPHRAEHLRYPGAGHVLGWPHISATMRQFRHPVSGEELDMGGSAAGTAAAREDSWPRMLAFWRDALAP